MALFTWENNWSLSTKVEKTYLLGHSNSTPREMCTYLPERHTEHTAALHITGQTGNNPTVHPEENE